MPSKYVAVNPRAPKVDMTDVALLARRAREKGAEIREARFRCVTSGIKRELRHLRHYEIVDVLCHYMQLDELESILVDIKAKRKRADALAQKNRHRQAS